MPSGGATSGGVPGGSAGGISGSVAGTPSEGGEGSEGPSCTPGVDCCPAHTGMDVFVDPSAGSDDEAGGFRPTGVEDPPRCRFRTITHGLSRVGTARRVVALSETLPATFDAEEFPLEVPAGVTLTAGSTTWKKGDYRILYDGSSAGIRFAPGVAGEVAGSAQRLSVIGDGGSGALLSCSGSGSVKLDQLVVDGGGSLSLVGAQLACPAKVTNVEVRGVKTGISTDGFQNVTSDAASVYVEILGSTISNCGLGVDAWGRSVTVSASVVEKNDQGCIFNSRDANVYDSKIRDNHGTGVEFRGSRQLQVAGGLFANNAGAGLVVSSGLIANLSGATFEANGFGTASGSTPAGSGVRFDGGRDLRIQTVVAKGNAAHGVHVSSKLLTDATPSITDSRFLDNGGAGLQFDGAASSRSITNNQASGNKQGGMAFTSWTNQGAFYGNILHSNAISQLRLLAPDVAATLDLDCDSANRFYCYAAGSVGVEVAPTSTLELPHHVWANAAPAANVDYKGSVTAGSPCTPLSCQ